MSRLDNHVATPATEIQNVLRYGNLFGPAVISSKCLVRYPDIRSSPEMFTINIQRTCKLFISRVAFENGKQ